MKHRGQANQSIADVYLGLRQMILTTDPKGVGVSVPQGSLVYGVVMDTAIEGQYYSLVCLIDGTVSIYFSGGGGYIGMGQYKAPRAASEDVIALSNDFIEVLSSTTDFPLPKDGHTRFYFLTFDGVLTSEASENDLRHNRVPLTGLFYKAQATIAQCRLVEERINALINAAGKGDMAFISKLIDQDQLYRVAHNKDGLTPLIMAANVGQDEVVRQLIALGLAIDHKDKTGNTALMFASDKGHFHTVKILVECGANIHERSNEDYTPIMLAAMHGHKDVVWLLLKHGADAKDVGKHGMSAIAFAKQNKHSELESILCGCANEGSPFKE